MFSGQARAKGKSGVQHNSPPWANSRKFVRSSASASSASSAVIQPTYLRILCSIVTDLSIPHYADHSFWFSQVAYHNYYRTLHGQSALAYDATIAANAQAYVNSMSPNGGGCSTHSSGSGYGENLAWVGSQLPGPDFGYNDAAQSWYNYNNYNDAA